MKANPRVSLPILLLATLGLCGLLGSPATADVMPEGQKNVDVTHALSGALSVGPTHTLMLVTGNHRYRQALTLTRVQDGELDVPSGYQDWSYLAALTKPQLVAIAKAALATPAYATKAAELGNAPADEELVRWVVGGGINPNGAAPSEDEDPGGGPGKLLDADDVARSGYLPFRRFVDDSAATARIHVAWTVTGVAQGTLQVAGLETHYGAGGKPLMEEPGESGSWLPYAGGAVVVLLLGLAILAWKRRGV